MENPPAKWIQISLSLSLSLSLYLSLSLFLSFSFSFSFSPSLRQKDAWLVGDFRVDCNYIEGFHGGHVGGLKQ